MRRSRVPCGRSMRCGDICSPLASTGRIRLLLSKCKRKVLERVRMQVGFRDLTFWSFLLASAYGADLMLLPVLLGSRTVAAADYLAGAITCPRPLALWQHCSPPRS